MQSNILLKNRQAFYSQLESMFAGCELEKSILRKFSW